MGTNMRALDLSPGRLAMILCLLVFFGVFLIYPLIYMTANAFIVNGKFTTEFFRLMITDPTQWNTILNSVNLGLAVTLVTTIISLPMAAVMARHEFRGKALLNGLVLVPMVLPPFVGAVGMRQMFARFGSVNLWLLDLGLIDQPIDWLGGGMLGVVIMEVLHLYPIMFLNVPAALANVDPSLEEAARGVGAGRVSLFRRITFPLMLPGYFAGAVIVFIWAFTDLGTPLVFEYRQVVPVQIFDMLSDVHENPMGYALVVLMLVMTLVFFGLARNFMSGHAMMSRGHVTGASSPLSRPATIATHVAFLGITILALIPHFSVILTSIADRWYMTPLPSLYTSKYYAMVFDHELTTTSIRNSLGLSAISTALDVVIGIWIAYLLTRTRIPGRQVLDSLAMLPLAVPGIIIAFGYVGTFSGTFLDARNNPVPLLIIAYAVRRLPYMVRAAYAGFQQTSVSLEEAAQNVGASPARSIRRITIPLIFANLVAGGILCFSFAMLEVSDSLILAFEQRYYPITKAIYNLMTRPDGPFIASAMGVIGMALLMAGLLIAGRVLGRRMGELFRA